MALVDLKSNLANFRSDFKTIDLETRFVNPKSSTFNIDSIPEPVSKQSKLAVFSRKLISSLLDIDDIPNKFSPGEIYRPSRYAIQKIVNASRFNIDSLPKKFSTTTKYTPSKYAEESKLPITTTRWSGANGKAAEAVNYISDTKFGLRAFVTNFTDPNTSQFLGVAGAPLQNKFDYPETILGNRLMKPARSAAFPGPQNFIDDIKFGATGFTTNLGKSGLAEKSQFLGISGAPGNEKYSYPGDKLLQGNRLMKPGFSSQQFDKKQYSIEQDFLSDKYASGFTTNMNLATKLEKSQFKGISGLSFTLPDTYIIPDTKSTSPTGFEIGKTSLNNQLGNGSRFKFLKDGAVTSKIFSVQGYNFSRKYDSVVASIKNQPQKSLLYTSSNPAAIEAEYKKFNLRDEAHQTTYMHQPYILRGIQRKGNEKPQYWGFGSRSGFDDGLIRGGVVTVADRIVADTVRIAKWMASPKGLLWIVKQIGLGLTNPKVEAVGGTFGRQTRIHTGIASLLSVPGTALGLHFTRHGIPFANETASYENVSKEKNKLDTYLKISNLDQVGNRLITLRDEYANVGQVDINIGSAIDTATKALISKTLGAATLRGLAGAQSVYGIGSTSIRRVVDTQSDAVERATKQNFTQLYNINRQYNAIDINQPEKTAVTNTQEAEPTDKKYPDSGDPEINAWSVPPVLAPNFSEIQRTSVSIRNTQFGDKTGNNRESNIKLSPEDTQRKNAFYLESRNLFTKAKAKALTYIGSSDPNQTSKFQERVSRYTPQKQYISILRGAGNITTNATFDTGTSETVQQFEENNPASLKWVYDREAAKAKETDANAQVDINKVSKALSGHDPVQTVSLENDINSLIARKSVASTGYYAGLSRAKTNKTSDALNSTIPNVAQNLLDTPGARVKFLPSLYEKASKSLAGGFPVSGRLNNGEIKHDISTNTLRRLTYLENDKIGASLIDQYITLTYNKIPNKQDKKSLQDFRSLIYSGTDNGKDLTPGQLKQLGTGADENYYSGPDNKNLETAYGFGNQGAAGTTTPARGKGSFLREGKRFATGGETYGTQTNKDKVKANHNRSGRFILARNANFRGDKITAIDIGSSANKIELSEEIYDKTTKDLIKFWFEDGDTGLNVMPFRATLTGLSDSFSPGWTGISIMGRPDGAALYSSFERAISFEFKVAALSRSEMIPMWRKLNYLASYTMPDYNVAGTKPSGPFMRLTIGDLYFRCPGYLTSLTYTFPEDSSWDIADDFDLVNNADAKQLPMAVDVSVSYTIVNEYRPQTMGRVYSLSPYGLSSGINGQWLADAEGVTPVKLTAAQIARNEKNQKIADAAAADALKESETDQAAADDID